MIIMNGHETLDYLLKKFHNKERIVFSRYGDGEYFLMTSKKLSGGETFETGNLLKESLMKKEQLICTVYFRSTYEELTKISCRWANTQRYIIENSKRNIYGTGAFLRRDYLSECSLLPNFFVDCLVVTGHYKETVSTFKNEKINCDVFEMPKNKASDKYLKARNYLLKNGKNYKNVIFSCGPIGKVLISDLVSEVSCNLIDFGSMINVILAKHHHSLIKKWTVSWTRNINLDKKSDLFFRKVRKIIRG